MLGAALASATLHLSDEIVTLQADLRDKCATSTLSLGASAAA
jgi:hypothetical protein